MASLTGNTIQSTYDSLLKVTDNDSITGSLKRITDGLGNNTPLYLSSSAVEIVSTLNVTSTITASNLSGTNTGDETKSSIETKLGAATSSNSGYLTSTDWSTFNNKIAGTGTLNKLAKFSSSSSIADSTITDTGSAVTIGVATSVTGSLTASSLIRTGGTSSQFLKADGSVDSTTYTPTSRTLTINGTTYDLSSNRTWTINPSQWSTNPSGPGIEYGDTVSIGGLASYTEPAKLFVAATNPDYGVIAKFKNSFSSTPLTGTKIAFETNGVGEWRMGLDGGTDYFVINRYDSGSFTESFAIAGNGKVIIPNNVGIGITNPVNKLDVSGDGKFTGSLTANSIIKTGGTSSQFLKADGSVDSNSYALASSLSSYVPTSRTLTINGTSYDLSADRSWTISTGVTGTGTTNTLPKFTGTSTIGNSNISDSGTLISLGSNTNIGTGALGIAQSTLTGFVLRASKSITGATSSLGISVDGAIQSDVTSRGSYYHTSASTQNTAFTLGILDHYFASGGSSFGSATVSNQYGFRVDSTLTGATNNFGFFSNIAAGTGRWNLYMAGTANNYLAGNLAIGTTSIANATLRVARNITGGTTAFGVDVQGNFLSDVTSSGFGFSTFLGTQAAAFTLTNLTHYRVGTGTIGAGSTVTNQTGFYVDQFLTGGTNNYAFRSQLGSGTNRWNLYMDGTANNYLAGNLGIGTTSPSEILTLNSTDTYKISLKHPSDGSYAALGATSNNFLFYNNGSERMRISSAGNVGIGTTSPASKLNVSGDNITVSAGYGIAWAGDQTRIMTPEDNVSGALIRYGSGGIMRFVNGSTEHMRINGSGNVGIGTTSPSYKLSVWQGEIAISNLDSSFTAPMGGIATFNDNANTGGLIFKTNSSGTFSERMRITSGGNVGIGTTSPSYLIDVNGNSRLTSSASHYVYIGGSSIYNTSKVSIEVSTDQSGITTNVNSSDTRYHLYFRNTLSTVGSISTDTYATSFNTSSDYRLKEDLKPFSGLSILKDIKVYDFKWKGVESRNYGVVAHEIAEVIPYAVNGEKDGEMHQSVDYSKLVPVLIQAMQEQQKQIEELKAKLENGI